MTFEQTMHTIESHLEAMEVEYHRLLEENRLLHKYLSAYTQRDLHEEEENAIKNGESVLNKEERVELKRLVIQKSLIELKENFYQLKTNTFKSIVEIKMSELRKKEEKVMYLQFGRDGEPEPVWVTSKMPNNPPKKGN